MNNATLAYITCPHMAEAQTLAQAIVTERLAACANILPQMQSVYWWEGKLEKAEEVVLMFKTRPDLQEALTAKVKELHSYDVPCVIFLPLEPGNPDYFRWIHTETIPHV